MVYYSGKREIGQGIVKTFQEYRGYKENSRAKFTQ
jgi:hypothetical protein